MDNSQQKSYLLPVSIIMAAVLVAGALVYTTGNKVPAVDPVVGGDDKEVVTADLTEVFGQIKKDQIALGEKTAPLTIVEFGDFQCPFCARAHREAVKQLREDYVKPGKVNIFYVDLAFLGPESTQSAQAAHCAGDQGKYWLYHDYLYEYIWDSYYSKGQNGENVGAFKDQNLKKFAVDLGLDAGQFNQCLDSKKYQAKVEQGSEWARQILTRPSTPSFFIGDKLIQGAQPYPAFKQEIENQLKSL